MHYLKHVDGKSWAIYDDGDNKVFVSTRRQCEEWLDLRENLARTGTCCWLKRLWRYLLPRFAQNRRTETAADSTTVAKVPADNISGDSQP
jgi:hypothetical protein